MAAQNKVPCQQKSPRRDASCYASRPALRCCNTKSLVSAVENQAGDILASQLNDLNSDIGGWACSARQGRRLQCFFRMLCMLTRVCGFDCCAPVMISNVFVCWFKLFKPAILLRFERVTSLQLGAFGLPQSFRFTSFLYVRI